MRIIIIYVDIIACPHPFVKPRFSPGLRFLNFGYILRRGAYAQNCPVFVFFGYIDEIGIEKHSWILEIFTNTCIMDCRLKIGGVYLGRIDRGVVR
jgi:hypothetical protein